MQTADPKWLYAKSKGNVLCLFLLYKLTICMDPYLDESCGIRLSLLKYQRGMFPWNVYILNLNQQHVGSC